MVHLVQQVVHAYPFFKHVLYCKRICAIHNFSKLAIFICISQQMVHIYVIVSACIKLRNIMEICIHLTLCTQVDASWRCLKYVMHL